MTNVPPERSTPPTVYGTETLPLSDSAFLLLRDLIATRAGVSFDAAKRGLLADKLSELVVGGGFTSFLEYYYALRYDDESGDRTAMLLDRLSVPETYFWRQPEHFAAIASTIARRFFEEHPGRQLRIWSSACCSGEEPLSMAIALAEAGMLDPKRVQILGTDASRYLIEFAKAGVYGERSFRHLPKALKEKYFDVDLRGGWRARPRIAERVHFEVANLMDPDAVARLATADIIFCRNVFIYFGDDTIREVVARFHAAMPDDGFLFVGAAESLTRLGVDFELAEVGGAFLYVKTGRRAAVEKLASRAPAISSIK